MRYKRDESWHIKHAEREPLLDSNTAEAIEKRGKELLGLLLLVLGVMAAMMIGSYTPDDPNWMLVTDAPAQNWLGRMGASLPHRCL